MLPFIPFNSFVLLIAIIGLPNDMLETPQLRSRSLVSDTISSLAVPVLFGGSIGTGLFITNDLILTCAHVVKETSSGSWVWLKLANTFEQNGVLLCF